MYEDLVKRLREKAGTFDYDGRPDIACDYEQAADAIEELTRENKELSFRSAQLEAMNDALIGETGAADALMVVSQPRWIPETERLPEDIDEEVLVCTEDYGVSGLGFVTVATYGANGWLECWERKTYLTAVTHWMPLPEPPKEET